MVEAGVEHGVVVGVFGVGGLLAIAVLVLPLARRTGLPYTVLLAAVGIVLGFLVDAVAGHETVVGEFFAAVDALDITSEMVLFVFLPALVFESALTIDVRRLLDDIAPILLLAVAGLLVSVGAVGAGLWAFSGFSLTVCLLLGAIVSATDPVAVVAIFKELGAPKRLAILVEGESLFNDATAIVAYTIVLGLLLGGTEVAAGQAVLDFLRVFVGGAVVGYLLARGALAAMAFVGESTLGKISLTISLAYLGFVLPEHFLHVSGVMALVTAALVVGSLGRTRITHSEWADLERVWEEVGFAANAIVFVLVGLAVPGLLAGFAREDWLLLAVLVVAARVSRVFVIFGLLPLLERAGLAARVRPGFKAVMVWGGLRGAVSLALALAVLENERLPEDVRAFVAVLVTGFVLFTLFVNATTVKPMLAWFGLDALSPADAAVRDRAMAAALQRVGDRIRRAHDTGLLRGASAERLAAALEERASAARARRSVVDPEHWLRIGLETFTQQEKRVYERYLEEGLLDPDTAGQLFHQVSDLMDAIRTGGAEAYRAVAARQVAVPRALRIAAIAQHRLALSRPLTRLLERRFVKLLAVTRALRQVDLSEARMLLPDDAQARLDAIATERERRNRVALDALLAAYPDYATQVAERLAERIAGRLEQAEYRRLLADSVIGPEVYRSLVGDLDVGRVGPPPKLDLGLAAERLVARVPFLAELPPERRAAIARLLRPRLALPGEQIIRNGDRGDAMYFVSRGAVRVCVEPEPVLLGSGDFIGEMALLSDRPRTADVFAESFCDLLALDVRDFRTMLDREPELRAEIERVAAERGCV